MSRRPVCTLDCFQCPYPDCTENRFRPGDTVPVDLRDTLRVPKPETTQVRERHRERSRQYYKNNREHVRQVQKAYRERRNGGNQ